ncbi:hypothetical protein [Phenylobacterium sp.]|jgi:hypothetical protein|uniref:hypothetical protein n=1 Tax=Phenylobacterium sp. TaxID=1871053 RepID=UPI002F415680
MTRLLSAASALALVAAPAAAQQALSTPGHEHRAPAAQTPPAAPAPPASEHDMSEMDHGDMPGMDMDHVAPEMTGALGAYPMTREASGTAWRPDASVHAGVHVMRGGWMLMGHALLNGVYDRQGGRRGDEMAFVSGMVMGMARRELAGGDTLQLRAMLSPDPLMGKRGYPLLLASGETADGVRPLVDRQHPHDLFMELSASYSHRLGGRDSLFLYAGLPGEPAFGPPAFMHRMSILDSPEAPISHHWLDSTHITFGVVTAGYVHDDWKVEASRFKGREPDQHRFDIETPRLDSTAVRLSWNPTANWSLQASWADVKSPEQLEPDVDQRRWSASAVYTAPLGVDGWWSMTAAWGRRSAGHAALDAWILEAAAKPVAAWTLFGRGERTQNDELAGAGGHHGPAYTVSKLSAGAIRDWPVARHLTVGLGGLYAWNLVPDALEGAYGGDRSGAMAFVRLKVE